MLPPLSARADELDRIIDAYAIEAGAEPGKPMTAVDREWVRRHEAANLPCIEKATRVLVAVRRANGSITRAAAQLGMPHGALSEWIARRTLDYSDDESES